MTPLRGTLLLLAMLLAILAMIWPLRWPRPPSARAFAAYFVSLVFALAVMLLFPYGHGDTVPFFGTIGLIAWVGLGALWLARRRPDIPNPDWVRTPWSPADWGLIIVVVLSGLAAALG